MRMNIRSMQLTAATSNSISCEPWDCGRSPSNGARGERRRARIAQPQSECLQGGGPRGSRFDEAPAHGPIVRLAVDQRRRVLR